MKSTRSLIAVAILIGIGTPGLSGAQRAHGQQALRSVAFQATYTGTLSIGRGGIGRRHETGTATVLGKSTLSATDTTDRTPYNDPDATCLAVTGAGVLRAANGDEIKFLYLLGACPFKHLPAGHYFVYAGTGKYTGAHGQGRLAQGGTPGSGGQSVPTTVTFTGTLILPLG